MIAELNAYFKHCYKPILNRNSSHSEKHYNVLDILLDNHVYLF